MLLYCQDRERKARCCCFGYPCCGHGGHVLGWSWRRIGWEKNLTASAVCSKERRRQACLQLLLRLPWAWHRHRSLGRCWQPLRSTACLARSERTAATASRAPEDGSLLALRWTRVVRPARPRSAAEHRAPLAQGWRGSGNSVHSSAG